MRHDAITNKACTEKSQINAAVQYVTLEIPPINCTCEECKLEYFKDQNNEAHFCVIRMKK